MDAAKPARNFLQKIFLSPDEARLRAGWRLLLQTILLLVLILCLGLVIQLSLSQVNRSGLQGAFAFSELIEFLGVTLSVLLARRFFDKRSFVSLGLKLNRQALYDLMAGAVIPFFMMGLIFLLEWALGWLRFEGFAWNTQPALALTDNLLLMLIVLALVGWNEELLSRGYQLQNLADGLNLTWGVILSSAIFGMLHLGNPNATWFAAAGIFCAGLFLAFGYLRTHQLWLPIGLHLGWNFFEGVGFGFPVSGLDMFKLTHITVSGPKLWTGGAFGPEAGLLILPAILLGVMLVFFYTKIEHSRHTP